MNDEQFEATMDSLRDELAARLRARDTTQREALAQMEAELREYAVAIRVVDQHAKNLIGERDLLTDQCQSYIRTGNEVLAERNTAQAQLAEAVGLLEKVTRTTGWDLRDAPVVTMVHDFLVPHREAAFMKAKGARHAQAEQQEAKGAQAVDEHQGKYWAFRNEDGELCITDRWDVAKHIPFDVITLVERTALATQPAEWVDPVALHPAENLYNQGFADGASEAKRLNAVRGAEHE